MLSAGLCAANCSGATRQLSLRAYLCIFAFLRPSELGVVHLRTILLPLKISPLRAPYSTEVSHSEFTSLVSHDGIMSRVFMLCDIRGCKFMQQHGSRGQVGYEESLGVVIAQGLELADTLSFERWVTPCARWSRLVIILGTFRTPHCAVTSALSLPILKICKDFGYHICLQAVIRPLV